MSNRQANSVLEERQWVAYVGPFSFPQGTACTRRVWGISQTLAESGMPVVVGAVDSPVGPLGQLNSASPTAQEIWYQGLGAFDSAWSPLRKAAALLRTSAVKTVDWLAAQPTRPKAVILHGASASFLSRLLPWCRSNSVALICDVVEWYYPGQVLGGRWTPLYWSGEYSMRHLVRQCHGVIGISSLLTNYYQDQGCRIIRIPPTMDVTGIPIQSRNSQTEDSRIKLVYAGVPGRKDLLRNALAALRIVDPEGLRFRLRIVGPDQPAIHRLYSQYPQKAVEIVGRRSHQETIQMICDADFSILLRPDQRYAHAGFSTKVVESMTCGTPVICNLTSDLGEYIHDGKEGMVCKDHSAEAFAATLQRISRLNGDNLIHMRQAARAQAERAFDFRMYIPALRQFMDDVAQRVASK